MPPPERFQAKKANLRFRTASIIVCMVGVIKSENERREGKEREKDSIRKEKYKENKNTPLVRYGQHAVQQKTAPFTC